MSLSNDWYVIVNPTSGKGTSKRKWPRIADMLSSYGFNFKHVFTSHTGHSTELVQQAVNQGYRSIICVGGDGTIHNVINGIMAQKSLPSTDIHLGVIPIGTGNDWVKTYGISKNIEVAIKQIKRGVIQLQDLGKIELMNNERSIIYFNNLAGVGFDGHVVSKVQKYKHLGSLAYIFGAILGIFAARNFNARVTLESKEIRSNSLMILIGLCKYSGGGMQLTKNPDPLDGYFDISITNNFTRLDIISNIFRLFSGSITNSKKIITEKSNSIRIEILDNSTPFIQADGELLGMGEFKISLIPKALSFYN